MQKKSFLFLFQFCFINYCSAGKHLASRLKVEDHVQVSLQQNTYVFSHSRKNHQGLMNEVTLEVKDRPEERDQRLKSLSVSPQKFTSSQLVVYSFNDNYADHQKITVLKDDFDISGLVLFKIASKEEFAEMIIMEGPRDVVVFIYRYNRFDEGKRLVFLGENFLNNRFEVIEFDGFFTLPLVYEDEKFLIKESDYANETEFPSRLCNNNGQLDFPYQFYGAVIDGNGKVADFYTTFEKEEDLKTLFPYFLLINKGDQISCSNYNLFHMKKIYIKFSSK